jgi:hypothetical protein
MQSGEEETEDEHPSLPSVIASIPFALGGRDPNRFGKFINSSFEHIAPGDPPSFSQYYEHLASRVQDDDPLDFSSQEILSLPQEVPEEETVFSTPSPGPLASADPEPEPAVHVTQNGPGPVDIMQPSTESDASSSKEECMEEVSNSTLPKPSTVSDSPGSLPSSDPRHQEPEENRGESLEFIRHLRGWLATDTIYSVSSPVQCRIFMTRTDLMTFVAFDDGAIFVMEKNDPWVTRNDDKSSTLRRFEVHILFVIYFSFT